MQVETLRTRQDLATMVEMFPAQMRTIVNQIGEIHDGRVTDEIIGPNVNEGGESRRTLDHVPDWRYQQGDNWSWAPSRREHSGHVMPPAVHNRNVPVYPGVNITISEHPQFGVNRFGIYRRDLLWRRDINSAADESTLIATIAVKCTDVVSRSTISTFWKKNDTADLIVISVDSFAFWTASLEKLRAGWLLGESPHCANFERKGGASMRNFWLRYARVVASLSKSGVEMPDSMILLSKASASIKVDGADWES